MRRYSRSAGDGVGCDEVRSHEACTFVDGGATASNNQAYKQTLAAGRDDTVDTNGSERSRGELVDKCNRNLILAIMLSGLMAFGVAAEAQDVRVEVVGGAGIFVTERPATAWAEGGSTVWMRRLGVGSSHSIRHDGTMTFVTTFHVRYRIRPSKRRPAARTPSSSAPGPGTPTMTSASVSATHRLSSHGNRPKNDVLSFGWTRSDLPAASSTWTMADARARGPPCRPVR